MQIPKCNELYQSLQGFNHSTTQKYASIYLLAKLHIIFICNK